MAPRGRPRKKSTVTLDFTGVDIRRTVSEGRHSFEVNKVIPQQGPNGEYIEVHCSCMDEDGSVRTNFSFAPQALWKLKGFLDAIGFDTDGAVELDPQELVGQSFDADIGHRDYEGKKYAEFQDFYQAEVAEEAEPVPVTPMRAPTPTKTVPVDPAEEEYVEEDEKEVASDEDEANSEDEATQDGDDILLEEDEVKTMSGDELMTLLTELGIKGRKLIGPVAMQRRMAVNILREAGYIA